MKHIFIINPISGDKDSTKVIPWIEEYFSNHQDYEIHITEYPKHATEITASYSIRDDVCIYSVGGDGTAYEVLNGLRDGVTMAIIPNGTGNDFHRMIYKPKSSLKQILLNTIDGHNKLIDYGVANEHRFLNVFCLGFDGDIVEVVNRRKENKVIPKTFSYISALIKKIVKPPVVDIKLQYDNQIVEQECLLMSAMNGQYYGGGFKPTPEADITDGKFNVIMVEKLKRRQIIPLVPKYAAGKHTELSVCKNYLLSDFSVTLPIARPYCCDGEIFTDDYIVVKMMAKQLSFRMPKGSVYDVEA